MGEFVFIALCLMIAWPLGYTIFAISKNINELEDDIKWSMQKLIELEQKVKELKEKIKRLQNDTN